MNSSITSHSGVLTHWELSPETCPDKLQDCFDEQKVTLRVEPRSPHVALGDAAREWSRDNGCRVRHVRKRNAFEVIHERKDRQLTNTYSNNFSCCIDPDTEEISLVQEWEETTWGQGIEHEKYRVVVTPVSDGKEWLTSIEFEADKGVWRKYEYTLEKAEEIADRLGPILVEIAPRVKWFRKMLPGAEVSQALRSLILDAYNGMPLGKALYHVPQDHVDQWRKVIAAVQAASMGRKSNKLHEFKLEFDDATLRDMKRTVVDRLVKDTAEITTNIAESNFTEDQMERQRVKLRHIRSKAENYQKILNDSLESVDVLLRVAEDQAGITEAIIESRDVWAGALD